MYCVWYGCDLTILILGIWARGSDYGGDWDEDEDCNDGRDGDGDGSDKGRDKERGGGGWTRGKIREVKIGQDEEDCVGLSTSGHW